MNTRTKMGLGSVLAVMGALGFVLPLFLEWEIPQRPWGFLLGFVIGLVAGLGATLAISGLIDYRRAK